jgi:hypothetical protein
LLVSLGIPFLVVTLYALWLAATVAITATIITAVRRDGGRRRRRR